MVLQTIGSNPMLKKKVLVLGIVTCLMQSTEAASVAKTDFPSWNQPSASLSEIISFVENVVDSTNSKFIPVEDRIAVFDVDGTLLSETAPYYFDWMIWLHRILDDESYRASEHDRQYALETRKKIYDNQHPGPYKYGDFNIAWANAFDGMSVDEFQVYVKEFALSPVQQFTNLKRKESVFLPMIEVIRFLQKNQFTVYAVTGSDRLLMRAFLSDILPIKANHIIGSDVQIKASGQGSKDGLFYDYGSEDYLVRGKLLRKNLHHNKVESIVREIGKKPVLSFGNSNGDASMNQYVIQKNKYSAKAFMLMCDDSEREYCKSDTTELLKEKYLKKLWIPISMKLDFQSIYGQKVRKVGRVN